MPDYLTKRNCLTKSDRVERFLSFIRVRRLFAQLPRTGANFACVNPGAPSAWAGRTLDSRRGRRGTRQRASRHELLACQRRGAHHVQFQVALEAAGL